MCKNVKKLQKNGGKTMVTQKQQRLPDELFGDVTGPSDSSFLEGNGC